MTLRKHTSILSLGVLLVAAIITVALAAPAPAHAQTTAPNPDLKYYKGTITGVSPTTNEQGDTGNRYSVEYCCDANGRSQTQAITQTFTVEDQSAKYYAKGDRVVVLESPGIEGTLYYVTDHYRLPQIGWIALLFFAAALWFGKRKALGAFMGLGLSLIALLYLILPQIAKGVNPLLIGGIGAVGISLVTLYLAHGINKKTTIAAQGTFITIIIAFVLSWFAVRMAHMAGRGSEDALYVQAAFGTQIELQGLLLAGMIIGTLGVLDDITTALTATIEEIHKADTTLSAKELAKRGLNVGREHIASLINTLVLAYAGASLPLLLLFTLPNQPMWVGLNSQLVSEEVVRTLVGSIALVLAVPITAAIAARSYGTAADSAPSKERRQK